MPVHVPAMLDELEKIAKTRLMKEVTKQFKGMGPKRHAVLEADPHALPLLESAQAGGQTGYKIPNLHRREIERITDGTHAAQVSVTPAPVLREGAGGGAGAGKRHRPAGGGEPTPQEDVAAQNLGRHALKVDKEKNPYAWRPDVSKDMTNLAVDAPGARTGRIRFEEYDDRARLWKLRELDSTDPLVQRRMNRRQEMWKERKGKPARQLSPFNPQDQKLRAMRDKPGLREEVDDLWRESRDPDMYDQPMGWLEGKQRRPMSHGSLMDVRPGHGMTVDQAARLTDLIERVNRQQGINLNDLHQANVGYASRSGDPRNIALFDLGRARETYTKENLPLKHIVERLTHHQGPVGHRFTANERQDFVRDVVEAVRKMRVAPTTAA